MGIRDDTPPISFESDSETIASELEPTWASKRKQRIYFDGRVLCSVDTYNVDVPAADKAGLSIGEALDRRRSTSGFSAFFEDREDGGVEYLLDLYGVRDPDVFTTLVFIERIRASDVFYVDPEVQNAIFRELGRHTAGAGLLCCGPTEQTFLDLKDSIPRQAPFTNIVTGDNPRPRVMDADLIFSRNHFSFLFEIDKAPNGERTKPRAPVFLRPFTDGLSLPIKKWPKTKMPGSRNLLGSELPGPRGVFVSRESQDKSRLSFLSIRRAE